MNKNLNTCDRNSNFHSLLLFSCPSWVILMASGLWLIQANSLKAMNEEFKTPYRTQHAKKNCKSSDHPLTQPLWKKKERSNRLKSVQADITIIKEKIINYKINAISKEEIDSIKYEKIFQCNPNDTPPIQNLEEVNYNHLLINSQNSLNAASGYTGAEVLIVPCNNGKVAIKKFGLNKLKEGWSELLYSLIALDMNPSPQEIKMAKIYDAAFCPGNCLSLIMEGASGHDIHHFLSTGSPTNAIKACAEYLALFHIKNHQKLSKNTNRQKYITYISRFFNTLTQNPSKETEENKLDFLSLAVRKPWTEIDFTTSSNVIRLLSENEQKDFVRFAKRSATQFEENSSEIYRSLQSWNVDKEKSYFLTITHGDAHGNNFFYDDSDNLIHPNGSKIRKDSFYRITMIDYASIIATYGDIGDPAEDVGRFLGSLWDWYVRQNELTEEGHKKIFSLQDQFIQSYLKKVTESKIFSNETQKTFEKMLKENSNFYKLRFYRAIFNAKKDKDSKRDKDIKLKILRSWIKENAILDSSPKRTIQQHIYRKESKERSWKTIKNSVTHCYLPDRQVEFIESAPQGADKSYLTLLWEQFHSTCRASLSPQATIIGMGGVGKTSLALEYSHEALNKKAYNLIHWLPSETEGSLLKGYRELLLDLGVSVKGLDNEKIINLVNEQTRAKGKCLLIYDNIPNPNCFSEFLGGKIPQNADILITSRCRDGWNRPTLDLDVFRPKDSLEYLCNVTGLKRTKDNEEKANDLAQELAHLPLALSHAANYIKLVGGKNVSGETFEKYLEDFREKPAIHFEEYRNPFKEAESAITYEKLIGKTVSLSRTALSKVAEEVIVYSSYLDPDSITEEIFQKCGKSTEEREKAFAQLSSLSLIKRIEEGVSFSLHRLVQLVIRKEKESKEKQYYQDVFLSIVPPLNEFFRNNISKDEKIDKLLDTSYHFLSLLGHSKRLKIFSQEVDQLEWASKILFVIAMDATAKAQYHAFLNNQKSAEHDKKLDQVMERDLGFFKYAQKLNYRFQLMGASPNLSTLKPGKLGLFYEKDKLYCIIQNKEKIEVVKSEFNPESFERILKTLKSSVMPNPKPLPSSDKQKHQHFPNDKQNPKSLTKQDKENLLKYVAGRGYMTDDLPNWLVKIAEQSQPKLQKALSTFYSLSRGIPKNEEKAFMWCKKAAEQRDADAEVMLGFMYVQGRGVKQDDREAVNWITKAAEKGHAEAQGILGYIYETGQGMAQSKEQAIKWYTLSAQQGHPHAKADLERLTEKDDGKDKNSHERIIRITNAVEQGDIEALMRLAEMYETGQGVSQNDEEALKLYRLAVKRGHPYAQENVDLLSACQDVDHKNAKAVHGYIKSAQGGKPEAQVILGYMYEIGRGVPKDDKEAAKWYLEAARGGNAKGQESLGYMYEFGQGVTQNDQEAAKWYLEAAKGGNATAQYALGNMYREGRGVPQNDTLAIKWYTKAAEGGLIAAQVNLARMYEMGWGVPKDESQAIFWSQKAADRGSPDAQLMLVMRYESGQGFYDEKKALQYLQEAADLGHPDAQCRLGIRYERGLGVNKDEEKSLQYFQKAARKGHPYAQSDLKKKGYEVKHENFGAVASFPQPSPQGYTSSLPKPKIKAEKPKQSNINTANAPTPTTVMNPNAQKIKGSRKNQGGRGTKPVKKPHHQT